MPDWTGATFYVDPELEDQLAATGLPGATRSDAAAPSALAAAVLLAPAAPAASPAAPPASTDLPPYTPRTPDPDALPAYPWEAARQNADAMNDLSRGTLGSLPFTLIPAAPPPGLKTRALAELLRQGWTTEAQAVGLVGARLHHEKDRRAAFRAILEAPLPPLAILFACACVANSARLSGDAELSVAVARELVERLDRLAAPDGGLERWLPRHWPAEARPGDELGTVAISCAANAAVWRIGIAVHESDKPPAPMPLVDAALASLSSLRDWLLDRAGARAGEPAAARIAAARASLSGSSLAESQVERWREAIREHAKGRAPTQTLREYAVYHATVLHSVEAVYRLELARVAAASSDDLSRWRPREAPTAALLKQALTAVARHCVQRATYEEDVGERLALLAHARGVAPWDGVFGACFDEARFRAGRWDDELLEDVARETAAAPSVGACAEYLRVAERLARRRDVAIACKRLRSAAQGSPHAWIADVRIAFARPHELADLARVKRLLAGDPPDAPDPAGRGVFALYGADPEATVAEYRRALQAQREAIEWAALVAEVRAEEARATAGAAPEAERPRPEVPRAVGDGSTLRALGALRWRLDRPKIARHSLAGVLEAHARRAGELVAHGDDAAGAGWLAALGGDAGLVPALDDLLRDAGGVDAVRVSLSHADAALDEGFHARWLGAVYARMQAAWPMLARAEGDASELWRRARAIQQAAPTATDAEARAAVDRDVTVLLGDAQAQDAPEPVAEETPSKEPADDFQKMVPDPEALDRSRRELDTPEWAIGEGLRQIVFYNLARGRRDLKMLRGTRDDAGALWELRHRDGRHPVRVVYVLGEAGPRVVAIMAKQDDAHQRRMIERVRSWAGDRL
jgi:hypothetical protein